MMSEPEQMVIDQVYNQGIAFLVVNSYSEHPHHRLLWADTALRAYAETFHNHLHFRVVLLPDLDVESFEEVFKKLPEYVQEEASHYQYVALAFVGHGQRVNGFDCLLTNSSLHPTKIFDIIAEFEKEFKKLVNIKKLFFFDMCRESDHPNPSHILLGSHPQLPQNTYVVFSTQCDSKAWDYPYEPGSHKYSVWSQHFNQAIILYYTCLNNVIASVNRALEDINQRAEVIDNGDIGGHILLPDRGKREISIQDKDDLKDYKGFMNVVRLVHGPNSIPVSKLVQPLYNEVLEVIRDILDAELKKGDRTPLQEFLQCNLDVSLTTDVTVKRILASFKKKSDYYPRNHDLSLFKRFVQEFPNPNLQAALSALERVQSEIRNDSHATCHIDRARFKATYHTFEVNEIPVAFVLNGSSFTHNCQSGIELVEFLQEKFPEVYFDGIKEGCLMAIFVFDLLLALQLPVLLRSHLPRLTDLAVTEVYISDLVRISVCSGKLTFLGSKEELRKLCEVYEEKLVVEMDPVRTDTLRSARDILCKLYVEISEQSLPHSEMPGGHLTPFKMFLTRLTHLREEIEVPKVEPTSLTATIESIVVSKGPDRPHSSHSEPVEIHETSTTAQGGGFDPEAFMDKFSERFLDDVDSHAIVLRLEINKVISEEVAHTIKHCSIGRGNEMLFLHLRSHANPDSISKLCDVMRSIAGYPRMSELGRDMKEELDLLTDTSSVPQPPSTSAGDTSSSQHPQSPEFYSLTPSDVGLNNVLLLKPIWQFLAVNLGVPVDQVQAYRTDPLGGLLALQYWRDGRSGQSFPSTWGFLLKNVEDTFGKDVAKDLEEKAFKEPTWSLLS